MFKNSQKRTQNKWTIEYTRDRINQIASWLLQGKWKHLAEEKKIRATDNHAQEN